MDNDVACTIISIYEPFITETLGVSKCKFQMKYPIFKKEIVAEIWGRLGFDRFLNNLPMEVLEKMGQALCFTEEVEDRTQFENALKEEVFIIGCYDILSRQPIKILNSALLSVREKFAELFENFPYFEDSYCVSESFDSEAFALYLLSFSFPHIRREFVKYVQNSPPIVEKLTARSLKKVQGLSLLKSRNNLLITSSEKDVLQVLVANHPVGEKQLGATLEASSSGCSDTKRFAFMSCKVKS